MLLKSFQIGIAGVALSHPYTFTDILKEQGIEKIHVWDDDEARLDSFCKIHSDAVRHERFNDLLQAPLDGVMVCTESHQHADFAIPFLKQSVPVFIDKVMAIQGSELTSIAAAARESGTALFSSSILRFSPMFRPLFELAHECRNCERLGARTTIYHSIEGYLKPGNTWQDEPEKGGGTLVNMGVHGVELLFSALGSNVKRVLATVSKRYVTASQSEDTACIVLDYHDGLTATVQVVGGTCEHGYAMDLFLRDGTQSVRVPAENSVPPRMQYGYDGLVEAFLQMVESKVSPVSLDHTEMLMRVLHGARSSVEEGSWIYL